MPIYEYACQNCGHEFEKLVSISAGDKPQACPKCGSEKSKKQMSMFSAKLSMPDFSGGGSSGPVGGT